MEKNNLIQRLTGQFKSFWDALRNTPEAFRLVWQASPKAAFVGLFVTPISALVPAAQAWVGKLIVDSILLATQQNMSAEVGFQQVLPYLLMELALVLLSSMIMHIRSYSDQVLSTKLSNHVSKMIMQKAVSLDLQFFEDPVFYDSLQNARRQADFAALSIVNAIQQILQQTITLISVIVLLVRYSPWLALAVVLTAIPSFLSTSQFAQRSFRIVTHRAPEARLLNYLESLLTGSESVKEIKLFGLGQYLIQRYDELFRKFFAEDISLARKRSLSGFLWGLLSNLAYYGSYGWVILRTVARQVTLGEMTMFLSIFRQSQASIRGLLDSLSRLFESNLFLDNLLSYLEIRPTLVNPENGLIAPTPIRQGIDFVNVSFQYPGSERWVLRDINLHIDPDERIALVGLNGAGKTTLIKLLTRLYDPTEGQILVDGHDLREFDLKSLHQRFGVIFQDFVRYQFSVRENIGFGQVEELDDMDRIKEAAERGGAEEVIASLKSGYETVLGRRWEKGAELSGGQWQKIALARAFMRKAEVMVLDEPTSALDAEAEYEVFQRFGELMEGRIAVLISHRFSTVRMADRIVVLSEGHISELGSHTALMANQGPYAQLFNLQAEGYR